MIHVGGDVKIAHEKYYEEEEMDSGEDGGVEGENEFWVLRSLARIHTPLFI